MISKNKYDLLYFDDLVRIRSYLEQNRDSNFPKNFCWETSLLVAKVIPDLFVVEGEYSYKGLVRQHNWNVDPMEEIYIDLTQDQFDPTLSKVLIEPIGLGRVREKISVIVPYTESFSGYDEYILSKIKQEASLLKRR